MRNLKERKRVSERKQERVCACVRARAREREREVSKKVRLKSCDGGKFLLQSTFKPLFKKREQPSSPPPKKL